MGISLHKSFPSYICSKDPQMQQNKENFHLECSRKPFFFFFKHLGEDFHWLTPQILASFEWYDEKKCLRHKSATYIKWKRKITQPSLF